MNYYGKMFYINGSKKDGTFGWALKPLSNITLVDDSYRRGYTPKQVEFTYFTTPLDGKTNCSSYFRPPVSDVAINDWPQQCQDVNASGIMEAIKEADIGMILFNANRLVGMNVLEALSNQFVLENQQNQQTLLGGADYAGTINWVSGSRAGKDIKRCQAGSPQELTNCYIGRFGWSAAAGTLEDQVSGGAGYPELNITANQGAAQGLPFRFNVQNCGPANQQCLADKPNSDLNEEQIVNLADYLRWLGVFNRSEYQVSLPIVTKGEQVFRKLNCQSCHVIDKTELDAEDNVLPDHFRQRLKNLTQGGNKPFVSYIGTDLLLHDMGYLSQVAPTPTGTNIRNSDGTIRPEYATYIYKIRTPPLMNLRFNRLVTDSHMSQIGNKNCDFLLHDGRACDAIEAAFLHDGPAVKKLNMIQELNQLSDEDLKALRAFLYSL